LPSLFRHHTHLLLPLPPSVFIITTAETCLPSTLIIKLSIVLPLHLSVIASSQPSTQHRDQRHHRHPLSSVKIPKKVILLSPYNHPTNTRVRPRPLLLCHHCRYSTVVDIVVVLNMLPLYPPTSLS
jgi:hypothetical protein